MPPIDSGGTPNYNKESRCPSVQKCLNCEKADCDVVGGVPLDRSEIIAEINAGMLSFHALIQHDRRQGKRKKLTKHCRIEG